MSKQRNVFSCEGFLFLGGGDFNSDCSKGSANQGTTKTQRTIYSFEARHGPSSTDVPPRSRRDLLQDFWIEKHSLIGLERRIVEAYFFSFVSAFGQNTEWG
jgi:hypothetical protein